ncbi:AraC family transcriptional regulator [Lentilactobacillus sp. Marseille-Q4993]|uniref:AraC family transcriptional regulator n=1 Tax=Lentilactobacillus sp. Marseille-Q4993 TaxID=3039492 RepID=UPI0024BD542A|nr:AraC family transcriptional regulator [Lentilactobacillus sp. Marseille-Q4993]
MKFTCLDISEPVLHISSGRFTAGEHWQHKHMYHDGNFEIIVMVHGTAYLQVDNSYFELHEGECFALPPFHHLKGYKESPANTQYYWFHFFTKPDGISIQEVPNTKTGIEQLFSKNQAALPIKYKINAIDKVIILANQVLDVAKNNYFTSLSVDFLLSALLIQLSEDYYKSIVDAPISEVEARIDGIKEWIRANLSEKLRVNDVAEEFELNPHYLVRLFKNYTNMTVIQYINSLKLDSAKELLLRTNLPIKQIASMSFYPDEKRFMKNFKSQLNLTPSEYRRAYSKKFLDSSIFDPEVPITKEGVDYDDRFKDDETKKGS